MTRRRPSETRRPLRPRSPSLRAPRPPKTTTPPCPLMPPARSTARQPSANVIAGGAELRSRRPTYQGSTRTTLEAASLLTLGSTAHARTTERVLPGVRQLCEVCTTSKTVIISVSVSLLKVDTML